jgi:formate dehydrogenase subunit beta
VDAARSGEGTRQQNGIDVVSACRMCEYPVPDNVDLRLCVFGTGDHVYVESVSERGEAVWKALELDAADPPPDRAAVVEQLVETRKRHRDAVFDEFRSKVDDFDALMEHLRGCINCYNCRVACPVCYCRQCVLASDTYRHTGDQYMRWVDKRGAVKMPTDTLFYHLTRLAHMSTLCVGCGQCTSACPNGIRLAELFRTVADRTQTRFDYQPGRSVDEPQPLATFHDDELVEVTGQTK